MPNVEETANARLRELEQERLDREAGIEPPRRVPLHVRVLGPIAIWNEDWRHGTTWQRVVAWSALAGVALVAGLIITAVFVTGSVVIVGFALLAFCVLAFIGALLFFSFVADPTQFQFGRLAPRRQR